MYVLNYFFANRHDNAENAVYDPVREDFKKLTQLQNYSCFYPQQRIFDKFYERNCDALAVELWKKAFPDVDHERVI